MDQRTPEWYQIRAGKLTASCIADAVAKTKTGWGASRANLMARLIAERLTGSPAESYQSKEMLWGIETEPQARSAYEFDQDCDVAQVGFVRHPSIAESGCSPDGLIAEHGLLEIKCPNTATHLDALLGEPIPQKYLLQMQWQMACTERQWCDYVSFDPRLPMPLQLHIVRIPRDEAIINTLTKDAELFLRELNGKLVALEKRLEAA